MFSFHRYDLRCSTPREVCGFPMPTFGIYITSPYFFSHIVESTTYPSIQPPLPMRQDYDRLYHKNPKRDILTTTKRSTTRTDAHFSMYIGSHSTANICKVTTVHIHRRIIILQIFRYGDGFKILNWLVQHFCRIFVSLFLSVLTWGLITCGSISLGDTSCRIHKIYFIWIQFINLYLQH